jgi:hypothetical protein
MFIIYGSRSLTKNLGQHLCVCPHCAREAYHSQVQVQRWFTLFFIPIFPISSRRVYAYCHFCGCATRLPPQAPARGSAKEFRDARADGKAKRCASCSSRNDAQDLFCYYCGQRLDASQAA